MTLDNLAGVKVLPQDGNLVFPEEDVAKRVLIIGTAGKGLNYQPLLIRRLSSVKSEFGTSGTLLRGAYEANTQKAPSIMVMRVGGTAASLTGIGVAGISGGFTVTTELLDDDAGAQYAIFYDSATGQLAVYDTDAGEWVYDNDAGIDTGAVCVEGTLAVPAGTDIGTASGPIPMEDVDALPGVFVTYTAGTDGTSLSRMGMYEALYKAYTMMDFTEMDIIVPMNVYIDDSNVDDMTAGEIAALNWAAVVGVNAYPTADSTQDVLGQFFVQEYEGNHYFWWDIDGDGVAEIWPSLGAASSTTDINGDSIDSDDFHAVNFAQQLANFCYTATYDWQYVHGIIGFKMPEGFCTADLQTWIGRLPEYTTDPITGDVSIATAADNGSGMLGNKFMAGSSSYRGGVAYGGFIATDSGFMDGIELYDDNEHLVDIGKYISVCGAVAVHRNNYTTSAYISDICSAYGGFITTLPAYSAPTNKAMRNLKMVKLIKGFLINRLAGVRIVALLAKPKGTVISDSPTAARPDSDYQRLTTVRIVKAAVDLLRDRADPYLGEGTSAADRQAMQADVEQSFNDQLIGSSLVRYDLAITATPAQFVAGQAQAELLLVPKFELRQIFVNISLSAT
jgi:hypothetical protein